MTNPPRSSLSRQIYSAGPDHNDRNGDFRPQIAYSLARASAAPCRPKTIDGECAIVNSFLGAGVR